MHDRVCKKSSAVVFYDGGCPLCRREISHYRRLDHGAGIEWIDIHASPETLDRYRISWHEAMQRLHVLESDGRWVTGVGAFIAVWRRLPRYRLLARLIALPGVLNIAEWAYDRFAYRRFKSRCENLCDRPDTAQP